MSLPFYTYVYGVLFWISFAGVIVTLIVILTVISLLYFLFRCLVPMTLSLPTSDTIHKQLSGIIQQNGLREETVDVSGVMIHCVMKDCVAIDTDIGPGDPPSQCENVVVFIHGTASNSTIFFDVMKRMPENIKCIAIDLPNFGISGNIDQDQYKDNENLCERYAELIGTTLIQLGILEKTILVGHSLGGFLSIYVASRFPIKKLVLLNPAGILPTLGVYGYYWGVFFKAGLPTSAFHIPVLRELISAFIRDFWYSFYTNNGNTGHEILQRLITLRPFYSYWNTPAINTLMNVYKKIPTHICFGEDDTIIPSHIGEFLESLTNGEIMIHNITNATHNPCVNMDCFMKYIDSVIKDKIQPNKERRVRFNIEKPKRRYCGYSYHSLKQTKDSFQNIYNYITHHTTLQS